MPSIFLEQVQTRINAFLNSQLSTHNKLDEAIHYSVMNGGKRLRPALCYAVTDYLNIDFDKADTIAAALEMMHCYSLIHDDLPAMDDDDLRRGKPTCHIAYDEATAILAGDALQPLAFQMLCKTETKAEHIITMMDMFANASGNNGMVLGQFYDLQAETKPVENVTQLKNIHRNKTGALIKASVLLPAIAFSSNEADKLALFSDHLGLAFQIQDDILDITSTTEILGKAQGSDIQRSKSTYVSLLGLEGAKTAFNEEIEFAMNILHSLENEPTELIALTEFITTRTF